MDMNRDRPNNTPSPPYNFFHMLDSLIRNDNILLRTEIENINNNEENINNQSNTGCSEEFINNLDEFTVDEEILKKDLQCSICLDDFKKDDKCILLPCKEDPHYFHSGCDKCSGIKEWLKRKNTCPMCRTEFPKENASNRSLSGSGRTQSIFESLTLHTTVIPSSNSDSLNSEEINIPNPNNLENTITDLIANYLDEIEQSNQQRDIQLAIEASLNDI